MVLSVSGSLTMTVWKRRSSALSFSKYFWYSSNVVAPILRNSPRAKAGFSMLASMAPSPFPAPTNVDFVDEEDDAPFTFRHFVDDGFQTFLEFPFVFGTGNQRTHVEGVELFVFQVFRYVAPQDTMGQSFHDGRLALYPVRRLISGCSSYVGSGFAARAVSLRPSDDRVELSAPRASMRFLAYLLSA